MSHEIKGVVANFGALIHLNTNFCKAIPPNQSGLGLLNSSIFTQEAELCDRSDDVGPHQVVVGFFFPQMAETEIEDSLSSMQIFHC